MSCSFFFLQIFCIHNRVFIIEARRPDEAFAPCWSGDTNRPPAKSRSGFLHRYNLETILEKSIVVCMRACEWEAENEERERERESECVNGRDIKKKARRAEAQRSWVCSIRFVPHWVQRASQTLQFSPGGRSWHAIAWMTRLHSKTLQSAGPPHASTISNRTVNTNQINARAEQFKAQTQQKGGEASPNRKPPSSTTRRPCSPTPQRTSSSSFNNWASLGNAIRE